MTLLSALSLARWRAGAVKGQQEVTARKLDTVQHELAFAQQCVDTSLMEAQILCGEQLLRHFSEQYESKSVLFAMRQWEACVSRKPTEDPSLRQRVAELESELAIVSQQNYDLEATMQLRGNQEAADKKISDLKKALEVVHGRNKELKAAEQRREDATEKKVSELEEELYMVMDRTQELEAGDLEAQQLIRSLRQQLAASPSVQPVVVDQNAAQNMIAELQQQLMHLTKCHEVDQHKIWNLEQELASVHKSKLQTEQMLKDQNLIETAVELAKSKIGELEQALQMVSKSHQQAELLAQVDQTKMAELKEELHASRMLQSQHETQQEAEQQAHENERVAALQGELQMLRSCNQELGEVDQMKEEAARQKIRELEDQLKVVHKQNQDLKEALEILRKRNQELKTAENHKEKASEKQIGELVEEVEALLTRMHQLAVAESKERAAEQTVRQMEQELCVLRPKVDGAETARSTARHQLAEIENLQIEIDKLKCCSKEIEQAAQDRITELGQQLQAAENKEQMSVRKISELDNELGDLRSRIHEQVVAETAVAQCNVNTAGMQIRDLEEEVSALQICIGEMEVEAKKKEADWNQEAWQADQLSRATHAAELENKEAELCDLSQQLMVLEQQLSLAQMKQQQQQETLKEQSQDARQIWEKAVRLAFARQAERVQYNERVCVLSCVHRWHDKVNAPDLCRDVVSPLICSC